MPTHSHRPFQGTLPWGDGSRSSSDGRRFAVQGDSLLSSFYPRYFGHYDGALALYTPTSDMHSVYATLAISCAPREARYELSGILDNDTTFVIRDTHTSPMASPSTFSAAPSTSASSLSSGISWCAWSRR